MCLEFFCWLSLMNLLLRFPTVQKLPPGVNGNFFPAAHREEKEELHHMNDSLPSLFPGEAPPGGKPPLQTPARCQSTRATLLPGSQLWGCRGQAGDSCLWLCRHQEQKKGLGQRGSSQQSFVSSEIGRAVITKWQSVSRAPHRWAPEARVWWQKGRRWVVRHQGPHTQLGTSASQGQSSSRRRTKDTTPFGVVLFHPELQGKIKRPCKASRQHGNERRGNDGPEKPHEHHRPEAAATSKKCSGNF